MHNRPPRVVSGGNIPDRRMVNHTTFSDSNGGTSMLNDGCRARGLQEAIHLAESGDDPERLCKVLNALLVLETGAPEWTKHIKPEDRKLPQG